MKIIKLMKKAYNLAEVVLIIAIVGFIVMLLFKTIRPSYKAVPLAYSRVFTSLEDAIYNSYEKLREENGIFPGANWRPDPYKSAQRLCELIATDPMQPDGGGYINTIFYNCGENFKTVPEYITSNTFNEDNMAFMAANSMKFYISPLQQVKVQNGVSKNQIVTVRYFIVWVDLNGKKGPNRYGIDYFMFIFTVDGHVIPVGQKHKNNPSVCNSSSGSCGNFNNVGAEYCSNTASDISKNTSCAYYALTDTHPTKAGKNYWQDFLGEVYGR